MTPRSVVLGEEADDEEKGDITTKNSIQTITLGGKCPKESNKPLTVFAKHHVRADKLDVFESWCREMVTKCRMFEGYLDTEIIRPTCLETSNEYIAIFRYDSYDHLQVWMQSVERQSMINRIPEFSDSKSLVYSYHSLEHWFSSSDDETGASVNEASSKRGGGGPPPKYKMWLVTTCVIYTQTLWVPRVMAIIAPNLNPFASGFLGTLIIVTLATFIVFPFVTRLLAFWLFPGCNYQQKLMELVPSILVERNSTKNAEQDSKKELNGSARTATLSSAGEEKEKLQDDSSAV